MRSCALPHSHPWMAQVTVYHWGRFARCARAVHKVGTRPCPTCIVVPSTRNNEPCYAFI